jgi:hypothetical protein
MSEITILFSPVTTLTVEGPTNKTLYLVKDVLDVVNDCRVHLSHIKKVVEAYPEEFQRVDGKYYTTKRGFLALIKYLRTEAAEELFWALASGELDLPD